MPVVTCDPTVYDEILQLAKVGNLEFLQQDGVWDHLGLSRKCDYRQ